MRGGPVIMWQALGGEIAGCSDGLKMIVRCAGEWIESPEKPRADVRPAQYALPLRGVADSPDFVMLAWLDTHVEPRHGLYLARHL
jgi:hypothetical protein